MLPVVVVLELLSEDEIAELSIALRAHRRALERVHFAVNGDPLERRAVVWGLIDRLQRQVIDSICAACGVVHRGPCLERVELSSEELITRRA